MAANTTNNVKEKYQNILAANGIYENIEQVSVQDSGTKNDGMASVQQRVTILFAAETCKKPLELFVKTHTQNPSHEALVDELQAFEKEAQFFMEYLSEAQQFCTNHGIGNVLSIYPKCYYADKDITVLENLVIEKQFMLLPYEDRHDLKTAKLVLETLATHHAISFAMIKKYGGKTQFLQRFPTFEYNAWIGPMMLKLMENFFEMSLPTHITIAEKNLGAYAWETVEKLRSLQGKSVQMTKEAFQTKEDDFVVLSHGDFKNNNMMFRRTPNSIVDLEHIAIDFQLVSCSSIALDLIYYLFSSADSKVRQTQLEELLCYFLNIFNKISSDLKCPVELTYEELLRQYKQKCGYGLWYALALIGPCLSLIKTSENMDISKQSMDEWSELFLKELLKWIDGHPEKGKEMAQEIMDLLKEYKTLIE